MLMKCRNNTPLIFTLKYNISRKCVLIYFPFFNVVNDLLPFLDEEVNVCILVLLDDFLYFDTIDYYILIHCIYSEFKFSITILESFRLRAIC